MSFSASNTSVPWAWPDSNNLYDLPWNIGLLPVTFLALVLVLSLGYFAPKSNIPLVNPPAWWELRWQKQLGFLEDGMKIILEGRKKYAGRPFRVITTLGECIVIPPTFVNSIRNNTTLNFRKALTKVCMPGLHATSEIPVLTDVLGLPLYLSRLFPFQAP